MTAANLIATAKQAAAASSDQVVVVDANVALAKQVARISGLRLVGVWVGLDSVGEFEQRLEAAIADGNIAIPEDETPWDILCFRPLDDRRTKKVSLPVIYSVLIYVTSTISMVHLYHLELRPLMMKGSRCC